MVKKIIHESVPFHEKVIVCMFVYSSSANALCFSSRGFTKGSCLDAEAPLCKIRGMIVSGSKLSACFFLPAFHFSIVESSNWLLLPGLPVLLFLIILGTQLLICIFKYFCKIAWLTLIPWSYAWISFIISFMIHAIHVNWIGVIILVLDSARHCRKVSRTTLCKNAWWQNHGSKIQIIWHQCFLLNLHLTLRQERYLANIWYDLICCIVESMQLVQLSRKGNSIKQASWLLYR